MKPFKQALWLASLAVMLVGCAGLPPGKLAERAGLIRGGSSGPTGAETALASGTSRDHGSGRLRDRPWNGSGSTGSEPVTTKTLASSTPGTKANPLRHAHAASESASGQSAEGAIASGNRSGRQVASVQQAAYQPEQEEIYLEPALQPDESDSTFASQQSLPYGVPTPGAAPTLAAGGTTNPYGPDGSMVAPYAGQTGGAPVGQGFLAQESSIRGTQLQQTQRPASLVALELMEKNRTLEQDRIALQRSNEALVQELNENNALLEEAMLRIQEYQKIIESQQASLRSYDEAIRKLQMEKDGQKRQYEMEIKAIGDELDKLLMQRILDK